LSFLLLAAFLALLVPAGAAAIVPSSFHGVTVQETPTAQDVKRMQKSGVGSVRVAFTWFNQEPTPGQFNWGRTDDAVSAISTAGARVLPVVYASPAWLEPQPEDAPVDSQAALEAWRSYLVALVGRYGPGGTYSQLDPDFRPIRSWQLWNEPNLTAYWGSFPDPAAYRRMLDVGLSALRSVDPRATVMAAGLSTASKGMQPTHFLKRVLKASRDAPPFQILALHPYARSIDEMERQIRKSRRILDDAGLGRLQIAVTEAGWGSAGPPGYPPSGTPRSQARMVTDFFETLIDHRRWRVRWAYWYSWRDLRTEPGHCGFCTITGLLEADGTPKPALDAFRKSVLAAEPRRAKL
jgi:hypothetical protein